MLKFMLIILYFRVCIGWEYYKIQTNITTFPTFERYYVDYRHYLLFTKEVVWPEAMHICQAFHGRLAELNSISKSKMNYNRLADTALDPQQCWIGGFMNSQFQWQWIGSLRPFTSMLLTKLFWFRSPFNLAKQCLALDVRSDNPMFINLNCQLRKPFLCETELDNPIPNYVKEYFRLVPAEQKIFTLNYEKMKWIDAVATCHIRGLHLGRLLTTQDRKYISSEMLVGRPTLNEVWTSGYYDTDSFKWLSDMETVQWNLTKYINSLKFYNTLHRFSNESTCVSFSRTLNRYTFFLRNCNSKKAFLCEKITQNQKITNEVNMVQSGGFNYFLVQKRLSWINANQYCTDIHGYLLELTHLEDLQTLSTVLSMQSEEIESIWLGGRYANGNWIWDTSKTFIQKERITFYGTSDKLSCLSLNIFNEMKITNLGCDQTQRFICKN